MPNGRLIVAKNRQEVPRKLEEPLGTNRSRSAFPPCRRKNPPRTNNAGSFASGCDFHNEQNVRRLVQVFAEVHALTKNAIWCQRDADPKIVACKSSRKYFEGPRMGLDLHVAGKDQPAFPIVSKTASKVSYGVESDATQILQGKVSLKWHGFSGAFTDSNVE